MRDPRGPQDPQLTSASAPEASGLASPAVSTAHARGREDCCGPGQGLHPRGRPGE